MLPLFVLLPPVGMLRLFLFCFYILERMGLEQMEKKLSKLQARVIFNHFQETIKICCRELSSLLDKEALMRKSVLGKPTTQHQQNNNRKKRSERNLPRIVASWLYDSWLERRLDICTAEISCKSTYYSRLFLNAGLIESKWIFLVFYHICLE